MRNGAAVSSVSTAVSICEGLFHRQAGRAGIAALNNPNIAVPASLMGEPTRAAILMALCDGRAHAAGALADALHISAQSASNHLGRLVDGGLLVSVRQGRHMYYRLASDEVAHSIEALAAIAAPISRERLRAGRSGEELLFARSCYRHLAGRLGVALLQALQAKGYLMQLARSATGRSVFALTPKGERWAADLGLALPTAARREGFARGCIDWTERRDHLSGALANELLRYFEVQGFLVPHRHSRALRLSAAGALYFQREFGIELAPEDKAHPLQAGDTHSGQPVRV
jgi:DNA-binding transcriptional ArsR family regulator